METNIPLPKAMLFLALLGVCAAGVMASAPARADETVKVYPSSPPASTTINEYSLVGSTKTVHAPPITLSDISGCSVPGVTCSGFVGGPGVTATAQCDGGVADGGWKVSSLSGNFWTSVDVCFASGGCTTITAPPLAASVVHFTPYSQCIGSAVDSLKNYCAFNYTGAAGVSGSRLDDMFSIANGAGEFFEYLNVNNPDRLHYISRTADPAHPHDIMMPSGPPGTYSDYTNFINTHTPPSVAVSPACYPVNISLVPPPVTLTCGAAPAPVVSHPSCPAGYTGTITDTTGWVSAGFPTCWTPGATTVVSTCVPATVCGPAPAPVISAGPPCPAGQVGTITDSTGWVSAPSPTCWIPGATTVVSNTCAPIPSTCPSASDPVTFISYNACSSGGGSPLCTGWHPWGGSIHGTNYTGNTVSIDINMSWHAMTWTCNASAFLPSSSTGGVAMSCPGAPAGWNIFVDFFNTSPGPWPGGLNILGTVGYTVCPSPPVCPAAPAPIINHPSCPVGDTGAITTSTGWASAAFPTCWTPGATTVVSNTCAPAACSAAPAPIAGTQACPAGDTGIITTSTGWVSAPSPTCWTPGATTVVSNTCTATAPVYTGGKFCHDFGWGVVCSYTDGPTWGATQTPPSYWQYVLDTCSLSIDVTYGGQTKTLSASVANPSSSSHTATDNQTVGGKSFTISVDVPVVGNGAWTTSCTAGITSP